MKYNISLIDFKEKHMLHMVKAILQMQNIDLLSNQRRPRYRTEIRLVHFKKRTRPEMPGAL